MTKKEVKVLEKLYNAMELPLWKITHTAPTGKLQYAEEASQIIPIVRDCIKILGCGESYEGELDTALHLLESTKERQIKGRDS